MFQRTILTTASASLALALLPHPAHAAQINGAPALTIGGEAHTVTVTAPAPGKSTTVIALDLTGLDGLATATITDPACTGATPRFTCTVADTKQTIDIDVILAPAASADLYTTDTVTGTLTADDGTATATAPVTVTGDRPEPTPEPTPTTPAPTPGQSNPFPVNVDPAPAPTVTETVTETVTVEAAPQWHPGGEHTAPESPIEIDAPTDAPTFEAPTSPAWTPPAVDATAAAPIMHTANAGGGVNWWMTGALICLAVGGAVGVNLVKRRRAKAAADREPAPTEALPAVTDTETEAATAAAK